MQELQTLTYSDPGADQVSERIARALEQDIACGRLRPGQKLREEELSGRFTASRHHIREALTRLQRAGVVVRERNRGASVRSFTARDLTEIYEIREILQRHAAFRIVLPAPAEAIAALETIHATYEAAVRANDIQAIHRANDRFHIALFRLCGNEQLANLIGYFMDLTYVIRADSFADPKYLEMSRQHHLLMIRLLGGRDPWALAQLCVEHIQPSKDRYLRALA